MSMLGALAQAWVTAEASLPLGWRVTGVALVDGAWVATAQDGDGEVVNGQGPFPYLALHRLADALRELRGPTTG